MNLRLVAALFAICSLLAVHAVTSACSRFSTAGVERGLLGRPTYSAQPGPTTAPRNLAVVDSAILGVDDAPVPLVPIPKTTWLRPAEPLDAGAMVRVGGVTVAVTDVIDDGSPSVPALVSAHVESFGDEGCGSSTSGCTGRDLTLLIKASTDDHTAEEHLTYALFGGSTLEAAASSTLPIRLLVASQTDPSALVEVWDSTELDTVEWVALAAVDQAGNLSARTPPVELAD